MTSKRPEASARPEGQPPTLAPITVETLDRILVEPLRVEASAALEQGEAVSLLVGAQEDGARVETILFTPSGRGAQSTGTWVFRGLWSGSQLLTLAGHSLDLDGACFCRACDAANAVELVDDE